MATLDPAVLGDPALEPIARKVLEGDRLAADDAVFGFPPARDLGARTALPAEHQDTLLVSLEAGTARGSPEGPIPSPLFFETLRVLTVIGFLADPKHGGNRDFAGWKSIGIRRRG